MVGVLLNVTSKTIGAKQLSEILVSIAELMHSGIWEVKL